MTHDAPRTVAVHADRDWPLFNTASTRTIESHCQAQLPEHSLMQRAGLASAQLALAIAPHAQTIWIACGPGNNGGDGLEAAIHLKQWGKQVVVTCTSNYAHAPADAQAAYRRAQAASVNFQDQAPQAFDLVIDALLGIGCHAKAEGQMALWLDIMNAHPAPVLSLDVPSTLLADTGEWLNKPSRAQRRSRHTLSFLTLKPGLFTADGRDAAGQVWFNALVESKTLPDLPAQSVLQGTPASRWQRLDHNTHKGNFGDVHVVGGANGMVGASLLAAQAALHGGAGRVYLGLLDIAAQNSVTAMHPSLMVRDWRDLPAKAQAVVCGCGGGSDIKQPLPALLSNAECLVLDADALNAVAQDVQLQTLLKQRSHKKRATVLTPHPLEAARLLQCTTQEIQSNRLLHAQALADQMQCVVVLKGSGSVIASPQDTPVINPTGNALLATAGTGDVLAGLIGARLAQGHPVFEAACSAVFDHGLCAEKWPQDAATFDAAQLAACLR
jgi:hydroxyethylthiazole kinase-like uncharacterized protein yjeF